MLRCAQHIRAKITLLIALTVALWTPGTAFVNAQERKGPSKAKPAAPKQSSSRPPIKAGVDAADSISLSWVFVRDAVKQGKTFEAWLIVRNALPIARAGVLTLVDGPSASLWLPDSGRACSVGARSQARTATTLMVAKDTLVPVCGIAKEKGTTHLLAQFEPANGGTGRTIALSDGLPISSRFEIGAGLLAVLTAAVGFLGGISATLITKWIETRASAKDRESEAQVKVLELLTSELVRNRQLLRDFIADPASQPPKILAQDYNNLLKEDELLLYLDSSKRKRYLAQAKKIYDEIETYNGYKIDGEISKAVKQAELIVKIISSRIP